MVGSAGESHFARWQGTVRDTGGKSTKACYLIVDDVDARHDTARAAGAEVVYEPTDQDYGGRAYACLDPEGNIWHFGSYDPWAPLPDGAQG